jgi:hypothetical protein
MGKEIEVLEYQDYDNSHFYHYPDRPIKPSIKVDAGFLILGIVEKMCNKGFKAPFKSDKKSLNYLYKNFFGMPRVEGLDCYNRCLKGEVYPKNIFEREEFFKSKLDNITAITALSFTGVKPTSKRCVFFIYLGCLKKIRSQSIKKGLKNNGSYLMFDESWNYRHREYKKEFKLFEIEEPIGEILNTENYGDVVKSFKLIGKKKRAKKRKRKLRDREKKMGIYRDKKDENSEKGFSSISDHGSIELYYETTDSTDDSDSDIYAETELMREFSLTVIEVLPGGIMIMSDGTIRLQEDQF